MNEKEYNEIKESLLQGLEWAKANRERIIQKKKLKRLRIEEEERHEALSRTL